MNRIAILLALATVVKAAYNCELSGPQEIESDLFIRQVLNPQNRTVTIELTYEGFTWLGIGLASPSSDGGMVGADVVIGRVDIPNSSTNPGKYHLTAESASGVNLIDNQNLMDASITYESTGFTVLRYTKYIEETDELPISENTADTWIYAVGSKSGDGSYPSVHDREGSFSMRLTPCKFIADDTNVSSAPAPAPIATGSFVPAPVATMPPTTFDGATEGGQEEGNNNNNDDDAENDDGEQADEETADGEHADEETADGENADEETADGENADEETADGEHADEETADGENADEETADGENADEETADGENADEETADGEHTDEEAADGENADEETADGENADEETADGENADEETADGENADEENGTTDMDNESNADVTSGVAYASIHLASVGCIIAFLTAELFM